MPKALRPAALLAAGYILGQGIAFLSQLLVKHYGGNESLGHSVLLISIFSFAIQFSEAGNSTFLLRLDPESSHRKIRHFLWVRAAIGTILTMAVSLALYPLAEGVSAYVVAICGSGLALLAALTPTTIAEREGRYELIVLSQIALWASVSICVVGQIYREQLWITVALPLLWVLSGIGTMLLIRSKVHLPAQSRHSEKTESSGPKGSVFEGAYYVCAPLGGQVLGRAIIYFTQIHYGIAVLGEFGLAKYMQVAATLTLSFILRPKHRKIALAYNTPAKLENSLYAVLPHYRKELVFSGIVASAGIVASLVLHTFMHYDPWPLLLIHLPLWTLASIAGQVNSAKLSGRKFLLLEYCGLFLNGLMFLAGINLNAGLIASVVIGESAQAVLLIYVAATAKKF